MSEPWHDKETLERLYIREGMSTREIGEQLGCSGNTISRWLRKHGIETRGGQDNRGGPWTDEDKFREMYTECAGNMSEMAREWGCTLQAIAYWREKHGVEKRIEPWHDEEVLQRLYVDQERSVFEVGAIIGCEGATVSKWLMRHDIDRRDPGNGEFHRKNTVSRYMHQGGYIQSSSYNKDRTKDSILMHRLLAVAKYGFDAVEGMEVHHRNRIPWDNRPDNIELMTKSEHAKHHSDLQHSD